MAWNHSDFPTLAVAHRHSQNVLLWRTGCGSTEHLDPAPSVGGARGVAADVGRDWTFVRWGPPSDEEDAEESVTRIEGAIRAVAKAAAAAATTTGLVLPFIQRHQTSELAVGTGRGQVIMCQPGGADGPGGVRGWRGSGVAAGAKTRPPAVDARGLSMVLPSRLRKRARCGTWSGDGKRFAYASEEGRQIVVLARGDAGGVGRRRVSSSGQGTARVWSVIDQIVARGDVERMEFLDGGGDVEACDEQPSLQDNDAPLLVHCDGGRSLLLYDPGRRPQRPPVDLFAQRAAAKFVRGGAAAAYPTNFFVADGGRHVIVVLSSGAAPLFDREGKFVARLATTGRASFTDASYCNRLDTMALACRRVPGDGRGTGGGGALWILLRPRAIGDALQHRRSGRNIEGRSVGEDKMVTQDSRDGIGGRDSVTLKTGISDHQEISTSVDCTCLTVDWSPCGRYILLCSEKDDNIKIFAVRPPCSLSKGAGELDKWLVMLLDTDDVLAAIIVATVAILCVVWMGTCVPPLTI